MSKLKVGSREVGRPSAISILGFLRSSANPIQEFFTDLQGGFLPFPRVLVANDEDGDVLLQEQGGGGVVHVVAAVVGQEHFPYPLHVQPAARSVVLTLVRGFV